MGPMKVPATPKAAAPHQSQFVAKLLRAAMGVLKVPRLPRKSSLRCCKCHACHVKSTGATSVPVRRQASVDSYTIEVLKVPHLPRKSSLRCWKCHACHVKSSGATSVPVRRQASADRYGGTESATPATQTELEVLKVSRLPRQKQRCTSVPLLRQASADIYGGTESATPATQIKIEPKVLKVSLPGTAMEVLKAVPVRRQASADSWKCHACHANRAWGAESVTPARSKAAAPHQSQFVAKLPRTAMEVLKVPHLPRKPSLRRWKCHACHVKSTGATSVQFVAKLPWTAML